MFNKWIPPLCSVAIGFFILGLVNLQNAIGRLEQKFSVVAFLETGLASAQVKAVQEQIEVLANVDTVVYTSPEKALSDFTQSPEIAEQVQTLGENPLPGSFVISVKDPHVQRVKPLVKRLHEISYIQEVKYGEAEADKVQQIVTYLQWTKYVAAASGWLFLFLLLFYVYSANLCGEVIIQRKKVYGELSLITLGSMVISFLLLYGIFHWVLAPRGNFVFLSSRHSSVFLMSAVFLQVVSVESALLRYRLKKKND